VGHTPIPAYVALWCRRGAKNARVGGLRVPTAYDEDMPHVQVTPPGCATCVTRASRWSYGPCGTTSSTPSRTKCQLSPRAT